MSRATPGGRDLTRRSRPRFSKSRVAIEIARETGRISASARATRAVSSTAPSVTAAAVLAARPRPTPRRRRDVVRAHEVHQLPHGPEDHALLGPGRELGVRARGSGADHETGEHDLGAHDRRLDGVLRAVHAVRLESAAEELHPARVSHRERFCAGACFGLASSRYDTRARVRAVAEAFPATRSTEPISFFSESQGYNFARWFQWSRTQEAVTAAEAGK